MSCLLDFYLRPSPFLLRLKARHLLARQFADMREWEGRHWARVQPVTRMAAGKGKGQARSRTSRTCRASIADVLGPPSTDVLLFCLHRPMLSPFRLSLSSPPSTSCSQQLNSPPSPVSCRQTSRAKELAPPYSLLRHVVSESKRFILQGKIAARLSETPAWFSITSEYVSVVRHPSGLTSNVIVKVGSP